jgi:alpha-1,6-mannosyltransferase
MPDQIIRGWWIIFGLLFIALAFGIHQDQFFFIAGFTLLIFVIYFFIGIRYPEMTRNKESINVFLKIILIFAFPLASDDIYRFYWDGCTMLDGISPFKYKPIDLIQVHPASWQLVYDKLNSREYFSVYPPILQGLFAICAFLSLHSIYLFSILWKGILVVSDFAAIRLLNKIDLIENKRISYWFAWNPLVIYEVIINGHPEGLMVFFLVACIYYLKTSKYMTSSGMLSLAAAIKIFPVILLLFIPKFMGLKPGFKFAGLSVLLFLLCMIPVYPFQDHMLESLHLYFGRFEFNGSLFELWKTIDYWRFGFDNVDHIAPYLSAVFILVCIVLFLKQRKEDLNSFLQSISFTWFGYLLLSTTVHPWYIIALLVLGLFAHHFFIIIWTGCVLLSYSWYDTAMDTGWKYVFIFLEYALVFSAFVFNKKVNKIISYS